MDEAEDDIEDYGIALGVDDTANDDHDQAAIKVARAHERQKMEEFELGECIPIEELQDHKHLKARWVDDKRDNGWRCRYVAKEMRSVDPHMEGLFTPGSCGDVGRLIGIIGIKKNVFFLLGDATNAYWHVAEDELVACDSPPEMLEERRRKGLRTDVWLKLKKKHYGRRNASAKHGLFVSGLLADIGCERCPRDPSFLRHVQKEFIIEIHQDDIHITGPEASLEWIKYMLGGNIPMKWLEVIKEGMRYSHLKRHRVLTKDGLWDLGNKKYPVEILRT